MKLITNILSAESTIRHSLETFGYTPDHNFDWLVYCAEPASPIVAHWEDDSTIWCYRSGDNWTVISDPIAPATRQAALLEELVAYLFTHGTREILFMDVREPIAEICQKLGHYEFDYDLTWPVLDMRQYDPALPGGHYKSIRNAQRKFHREHRVEVVPARALDPTLLHALVDRWHQHRQAAGVEELFPGRYHQMIEANFRGTVSARALLVAGQVVGLNAGWETPNQPSQWSAAIGLHDFSSQDLGLALMIEDLNWIKQAGYHSADLEGSEPAALKFKMQFQPAATYRTLTFSLSRS